MADSVASSSAPMHTLATAPEPLKCTSVPENVVEAIKSNDLVPALFALPCDSDDKKLKLCKRVGWWKDGVFTTGYMEINVKEAKQKGIFDQPRRVTFVPKEDSSFKSAAVGAGQMPSRNQLSTAMHTPKSSATATIDIKGRLHANLIPVIKDIVSAEETPTKLVAVNQASTAGDGAATERAKLSSTRPLGTDDVGRGEAVRNRKTIRQLARLRVRLKSLERHPSKRDTQSLDSKNRATALSATMDKHKCSKQGNCLQNQPTKQIAINQTSTTLAASMDAAMGQAKPSSNRSPGADIPGRGEAVCKLSRCKSITRLAKKDRQSSISDNKTSPPTSTVRHKRSRQGDDLQNLSTARGLEKLPPLEKSLNEDDKASPIRTSSNTKSDAHSPGTAAFRKLQQPMHIADRKLRGPRTTASTRVHLVRQNMTDLSTDGAPSEPSPNKMRGVLVPKAFHDTATTEGLQQSPVVRLSKSLTMRIAHNRDTAKLHGDSASRTTLLKGETPKGTETVATPLSSVKKITNYQLSVQLLASGNKNTSSASTPTVSKSCPENPDLHSAASHGKNLNPPPGLKQESTSVDGSKPCTSRQGNPDCQTPLTRNPSTLTPGNPMKGSSDGFPSLQIGSVYSLSKEEARELFPQAHPQVLETPTQVEQEPVDTYQNSDVPVGLPSCGANEEGIVAETTSARTISNEARGAVESPQRVNISSRVMPTIPATVARKHLKVENVPFANSPKVQLYNTAPVTDVVVKTEVQKKMKTPVTPISQPKKIVVPRLFTTISSAKMIPKVVRKKLRLQSSTSNRTVAPQLITLVPVKLGSLQVTAVRTACVPGMSTVSSSFRVVPSVRPGVPTVTTSEPISTIRAAPVSAIMPAPVSAITSAPVSAITSSPVSTIRSAPVSAITSALVSAITSAPVSIAGASQTRYVTRPSTGSIPTSGKMSIVLPHTSSAISTCSDLPCAKAPNKTIAGVSQHHSLIASKPQTQFLSAVSKCMVDPQGNVQPCFKIQTNVATAASQSLPERVPVAKILPIVADCTSPPPVKPLASIPSDVLQGDTSESSNLQNVPGVSRSTSMPASNVRSPSPRIAFQNTPLPLEWQATTLLNLAVVPQIPGNKRIIITKASRDAQPRPETSVSLVRGAQQQPIAMPTIFISKVFAALEAAASGLSASTPPPPTELPASGAVRLSGTKRKASAGDSKLKPSEVKETCSKKLKTSKLELNPNQNAADHLPTKTFLITTINGEKKLVDVPSSANAAIILSQMASNKAYQFVVPQNATGHTKSTEKTKTHRKATEKEAELKSPHRDKTNKSPHTRTRKRDRNAKKRLPILKIKFMKRPNVNQEKTGLRRSARERKLKRPYSPPGRHRNRRHRVKIDWTPEATEWETRSSTSSSDIPPPPVKTKPASLAETHPSSTLDTGGSLLFQPPSPPSFFDRDDRVRRLKEMCREKEAALNEILKRRQRELEERLADPQLCDL